LRERSDAALKFRIIGGTAAACQCALTLLRPHRNWPNRCAKPRDELPPSHLRALQRFVGKPIAIGDALELVLTAR
jgi:hypothetical protein